MARLGGSFGTPFIKQARQFVSGSGRIIDHRLEQGRRTGETYKRLRFEFNGLPPNTKFVIGATAAGVAASATAAVIRSVAFKDPNVKVLRAYRRQKTNRIRIKESVGGRPGIKVRYTGIRAGSIRSRSDRIYGRAAGYENALGRGIKASKDRGKARLRIESVKFPNHGVDPKNKGSSKTGFYIKTSRPVSAARGLRTGLIKARRVPTRKHINLAVKAGVYRGRSDRLRYKANKATFRNERAIAARKAHLRAHPPRQRRRIRVRRDSKGRYAGSY